ncbi:cation-transporting ATPase family protein [Cyclospora cayetanensis]|uniref:Phospholipid-transporting ATPase n=1 Tax=Cyclospora cayetanensis TaxID=88456 RepID=A0A1D3CZ07_9EIME|nr:cation-transporting ATPase family protein [Cyclospora cayetanensis]
MCALLLRRLCGVKPAYRERLIHLSGQTAPTHFTSNAIKNTKYSLFTFLPVVLFQQFRFFFNLFYLIVALAQLVPILQVGPLFTYLAPLAFVLLATLAKEAYDDIKRYIRDKELNEQQYARLLPTGFEPVSACNIRVGQVIQVGANQRVPADLVFLKTTEKSGSCFIRTDQLDGETDWKLRRAVHATQHLSGPEQIVSLDAQVLVEAPHVQLREGLIDTSSLCALLLAWLPQVNIARGHCNAAHVEPLGLDNVLWANTVVASGTVFGLAIYTGRETRASMNASQASTKVGLFDLEVNLMAKVLFGLLCLLALALVALRGLEGIWVVYFCRFILLLSSIIPISLQVNLIIAKTIHSLNVMRDKRMKGAELGRVHYLLSDKTGTLTQNEMHFKKLHIGRALFADDGLQQLQQCVTHQCNCSSPPRCEDWEGGEALLSSTRSQEESASGGGAPYGRRSRRSEVESAALEAIKALSICHNVTPITEDGQASCSSFAALWRDPFDSCTALNTCPLVMLHFQAASPDEVALVQFASEVGLRLVQRDEHNMTIEGPCGVVFEYAVLHCFPFSSELKRMGIIVQDKATQRIFFYVKGAETVMLSLVRPKGSQWLAEECDNFARQGLRTLVFAYKELTASQLEAFRAKYEEARRQMQQRERRVRREIERLEQDLLLLGLTGVEDKLQDAVPETLESLRHAGIKIWMLTGDKVETATCIAASAGLKGRHDSLTILSSASIRTPGQAQEALERFSMGPSESVLVVDGRVLSLFLCHFPKYFILTACQAPAVVCCRCSPTQKAAVTALLKQYTGRRTCAVGDGGNDVSMIQAADVGVGLEGKEGRQASLAADFSLSQFSHLRRLLLWHGRNSYQRSAKLAQFVVHRGLIIAVIQVIFSAVFYFIPLAIFQGWLQVGYATYYTTAPVLSLVLDVELPEKVVFMFPELYQTLRNGRALSIKSFFGWVWRSVYQGAVVMLGAILLFEQSLTNIVAITFTSLVLAELLNVASEIQTWHPLMVSSEICTVTIYIFSMFILRSYFDITFVMTHAFWLKVSVITLASWLPPHLFAVVRKIIQPPQYSKLTAA